MGPERLVTNLLLQDLQIIFVRTDWVEIQRGITIIL